MAPKTILFDYGQTLVHEILWDPLAGAEALLDCARKNPRNVSPAQLSDLLESIKQDILRAFGVSTRSGQPLEIPAAAIYGYAFRRLGLEFDLTMEELEWRYWQAGAPAEPAEHILPLLEDLERQGITLGVVSNLMYTGRPWSGGWSTFCRVKNSPSSFPPATTYTASPASRFLIWP